MQVELQLSDRGGIKTPPQLQKILGFSLGEKLIAKDHNGQLIIEKEPIIKQRLRSRFSKIPTDIDLAQELISDRKNEVSDAVAKI